MSPIVKALIKKVLDLKWLSLSSFCIFLPLVLIQFSFFSPRIILFTLCVTLRFLKSIQSWPCTVMHNWAIHTQTHSQRIGEGEEWAACYSYGTTLIIEAVLGEFICLLLLEKRTTGLSCEKNCIHLIPFHSISFLNHDYGTVWLLSSLLLFR